MSDAELANERRLVDQLGRMIADCERRALAMRTPDAARLVDQLRRTAQRAKLSGDHRRTVDDRIDALDAKLHHVLAELALAAVWRRGEAGKAARLDSLEAFRRAAERAVPTTQAAEALRRDWIAAAVAEAFAEIQPLADVGDRAAVDDAGMRLGCLLRDPAVGRGAVTEAAQRLKALSARADAARARRDAATAALEAVLAAAFDAHRSGDAETRDRNWTRFQEQAKPHLLDPLDAVFRDRVVARVTAEIGTATQAIAEASEAGEVEAGEALAGWVRRLIGEPALFGRDQRDQFSDGVRTALRNMYMLATHRCLDDAYSAARSRDRQGRVRLAEQGRRFVARALANGAGEEFAGISTAKFELVAETGAERHDGPTRAKPADQTARPYNAAKAEKRGARRYTRPVFAVRLADHEAVSIDWSLSGMRLACSEPAGLPRGVVAGSIIDGRHGRFDCAMEVIHIGETLSGCEITIRFQSRLAPLRDFLRACTQR